MSLLKHSYLLAVICTLFVNKVFATISSEESKSQMLFDMTIPFGWGACSDPNGTTYQLDGGWRNKWPVATVLYASGGDDYQAILDAVTKYDIIVLDGSKGDFVLSKLINLSGLQNKSIFGRKNARLCTEWYITPELKQKMIDACLDMLPDDRDGGILSNGKSIYDASEYQTRQMLIDYTGDQKESYRRSGIFYLDNSNENIMSLLQEHKVDLVINIPKNHTRRELTNGYKIRRASIDHNIPLMTNARLAGAFIKAFCSTNPEEVQIKSWQE